MQKHNDPNREHSERRLVLGAADGPEKVTTLVAHGRHRMGRVIGMSAPLMSRFSRRGWPLWWPYAWAFVQHPTPTTAPRPLRNF